jgi:haloacetate dehalogenase
MWSGTAWRAISRNVSLWCSPTCSKPPEGENHAGYSKRAMALDKVGVMEKLGFRQFSVVGHDRGGRVAHRLVLDQPDRVQKLVVLDIVPTLRMFETIDKNSAIAGFHWYFLAQPAPFRRP